MKLSEHPQIIWAPIRHHSPQCSWQLQQLLVREKPDIVLIEGPSEANSMREYLTAKATQPPVALYIYAVDNRQVLSTEDSGRYRAYVPFAVMSPEWNALQLAKKLKIPTEFIDLPYVQQLQHSEHRNEQQHGEHLLYSESNIRKSDPVQWLVNESCCRNFDEWWDRTFETGVCYSQPASFFQNTFRFGELLREAQSNIDRETVARESYMAERIAGHVAAGKRCLVVCGAFHCRGIVQYLENPEQRLVADGPDITCGVHLIPYSLARLNSASGYAAGMTDCRYYQALWSALQQSGEKPPTAESHHIALTAELLDELKNNAYAVSMPDIIESNIMCERLAELRGIRAGRMELRDALESTVIKTVVDDTGNFERLLDTLLAGNCVGRLPRNLPVAPIVDDFRKWCDTYKLPLRPVIVQEKALDIYRKPRQRELSRLFHQLQFLDIPYALFAAGPRFAVNEDLHRVREIWQVKWEIETEAALIECSHLGDTLQDAALHRLLATLSSPQVSGPQKASLLIQALCMGLHPVYEQIVFAVRDWVQTETGILHLCKGLNHLVVAYYARRALAAQQLPALESILKQCFDRLCVRLPWLVLLQTDEIAVVCESLASIHALVTVETNWCDRTSFYAALTDLLETKPAPKLAGVCAGALLQAQYHTEIETGAVFAEQFGQASLAPEIPGDFLQGFLMIERGLFVHEPSLQILVTHFITQLDEQEFLQVLPSLRLAFTYFNPAEKQKLAKNLVGENESAQLLVASHWRQHDLQYAQALRETLNEQLKSWGLADE